MDQRGGDRRGSGSGAEMLDSDPDGPRRRSRLVAVAAVCCLLLFGAAVWRIAAHGSASRPATRPSAASRTGGEPVPQRPAGAPTQDVPGQQRVTAAALSWLHPATDYDLYLRTDDAVYRVRPRAGVIVRTPVPELTSTGPLSFIPFVGGVLIAPLDSVPGYLVSDDGPVTPYGDGGWTFPGPDGRRIWTQEQITTGDGRSRDGMRLISLTGGRHPAPVSVPLPRLRFSSVAADGRGHLVVTNEDGSYSGAYILRPGHRLQRIGGRLIAAGPSRTLVTARRCKADCRLLVLGDGYRPVAAQPAHSPAVDPGAARGAVAPDGRTAVLSPGPNRPLVFLDLVTGRQLEVPVNVAVVGAVMAFSPDSRWLFAIGPDQGVQVIDTRTGISRPLGGTVTGVRQVAVRP